MSLYTALPDMAAIYGREVLGTYHERMGALPWPEDFEEKPPSAIWVRLLGYSGGKDGEGEGTRRTADYDLTFGALQLGLDLRREVNDNGQRDRAGLYAAFGHADATVHHLRGDGSTIKAGDTRFDAYTLGGYWTRTGVEGWYVDGVLQATWYDIEMSGRRAVGDGSTQGWGVAASVEGGRPFALDDEWVIEPQGQLVYQAFDFDDFDDVAAEVSYSDADALTGRIGARLARTWDQGTAADPMPATGWARVNVWHDFLDSPTTTFSNGPHGVDLTGTRDDTWGEIEVGADMKATEALSFYGDMSYQVTFDGAADSFGAEVGLKWRW